MSQPHAKGRIAALAMSAVLGLLFPKVAQAAPEMSLPPGAELTGEVLSPQAEARIAAGPWQAGTGVPFDQRAGAVAMRAWRIPADQGLLTLTLIEDLRLQLESQGFEPRFACFEETCGGFDFRFALQVLDEPRMHVDLGDYRYLAMSRPAGADGEESALAILVSRAPQEVYLQILEVSPGPAAAIAAEPVALPAPEVAAPAAPPVGPGAAAEPVDIAVLLIAQGVVVVEGLAFQPGSATISGEVPAMLAALGKWLHDNPSARVVLVGHTDAIGSLEANIALSRQRAMAVRDWLMAQHALPPGQVGAEGAGYLAPRATNETEEGRAQNRRVEVMLTPTR